MPDADPQVEQISLVLALFRSGGLLGVFLIALGFLLSAWALVNLLLVRNRAVLVLQALGSMLPALVAVAAVAYAFLRFAEMAISPWPFPPGELASVVGFGLSCGMIGPLATVVPATLGVISLARCPLPAPVSRTELPNH